MKINALTSLQPQVQAARATAATTSTATTTKTTDKAKLTKAAKEFESLLLKQLLTSAHVLGKEKNGYGDMALDALATGITDGGGIGLARKLEDTVQAAEIKTKTNPTKL